jgi:hypothetical protein
LADADWQAASCGHDASAENPDMSIVILITGIVLAITGIGFWLATGAQAVTSLIPAFLGVPLAICGGLMLAISSPARRHLAHVAAILALLGVLGGLGMGVPGLIKILNGAEGVRPVAVTLQLIMGGISTVLMTLMIRSFVLVRRERKKA